MFGFIFHLLEGEKMVKEKFERKCGTNKCPKLKGEVLNCDDCPENPDW